MPVAPHPVASLCSGALPTPHPPPPPRSNGDGDGQYLLTRNIEITADTVDTVIDVNFISEAVNIGVNLNVTFRDISLKNLRRGAGLGFDFFVGSGAARPGRRTA